VSDAEIDDLLIKVNPSSVNKINWFASVSPFYIDRQSGIYVRFSGEIRIVGKTGKKLAFFRFSLLKRNHRRILQTRVFCLTP
jgi:hypothetical protein